MTVKSSFAALCAIASLTIAMPAFAQTTLEACYQKATTQSAMNACLKQELNNVRSEYRALVETAQKEISEQDRVMGNNIGSTSFEKANLAFDRYVTEQCNFAKAVAGGGDNASLANLSCQINLLYWRMGIIENVLAK